MNKTRIPPFDDDDTKEHKIAEELTKEIQEGTKKDGLDRESYQMRLMRKDFEEFQDRISSKVIELREEIRSIKASINRQGLKMGGYTLRELMGLKQLGINPKDLIMGNTMLNDGEKEKKEGRGLSGDVSSL